MTSTHARLRLNELDLLRGIACAMVVAFHFLYRGPSAGWVGAPVDTLAATISRHGYLGVHLFFMISGFVIFMSAQGASVRSFAASRVARLYPAMWVAAPLTALAAWTFESTRFAVTPSQLLFNLTMIPHWFNVKFVDGSYWSLAVELQFYLLIALVLRFRLLNRIEWLMHAWLCLALIDVIRPVYPLEFWVAVNWAPYFCAGICAYLLRTQGNKRNLWFTYAVSFVLAVCGVLRGEWKSGAGIDAISLLVPALMVTTYFIVFALVARGRWQMRATRLTYWAGALTYPIYLLHQVIGYILLDRAVDLQVPYWLGFTLVCATLIGTGAAIHRQIELPLASRLRRWIAPVAASPICTSSTAVVPAPDQSERTHSNGHGAIKRHHMFRRVRRTGPVQ